MKILYNSNSIKTEIHKIYTKEKKQRIAISAFVGDSAEAYLPKRKGLRLYCWPSPSGTNPRTLRKLIYEGVEVFFSDRMHMKLYWTSTNGAIITSANLSINAFGSGNLKEIGIRVPSRKVNINKIVSVLNAIPATTKELDKLEKSYNICHSKGNKSNKTGEYTTFKEWYDKYKTPWRIGIWEEPIDISIKAINIVKAKFDTKPVASIVSTRRCFPVGEWILCLKVKDQSIIKIDWLYVQKVVKKSKNLFENVQVWQNKVYSGKPFKDDAMFKKAFRSAVKEYGFNKIKQGNPDKKLIEIIIKKY